MEISTKLKKRFCKDTGININIFEEPYFTERLELFDKTEEYERFIELISVQFDGNEQEYFEYYNKIKDNVITFIKETEAFKLLNEDDMNKYVKTNHFSSSDVYKEPNIGKKFISIDMRKANFTALVHYSIQKGTPFTSLDRLYDYERFMSGFTESEHIIRSKYIRQVIFGGCNPKRQVTYETFLMDRFLTDMLSEGVVKDEDIYSLMSDEILINAERFLSNEISNILEFTKTSSFPLKAEIFDLYKIQGSDGYIKKIYINNKNTIYELKCVSPEDSVFVLRYLNKQPLSDGDYVFSYNGRLARFIETPDIMLKE